jgi:hypothetical protein
MNERIQSSISDEFEYVFAGTGDQPQANTTCSTSDNCDKECVGGTANTSAMHQTMATA